jgi:NADH-quinone oxidoreductase subunit M
MSPLTPIIALPLLAALLLVFVPRNFRVLIRGLAILATLIPALLAIKLFFNFIPGEAGFQFVQRAVWVEALDISYHVGVDGINLGLILMGAIVAFAAACVAREIQTYEKEFYILLLVMAGGILGAFASLDLFFFFFFHELALVPTFIMIGVWGRGENKNYATFQITIYLTLGALITLVGLIALYLQSGANTFDLVKLSAHLQASPLTLSSQHLIFPMLLIGFGILVSLWPFHTWAPLGYASAPTATAMLHAGVLKKFGVYGLIRIAIPFMPDAMQSWLHIIALLCLGNIVYCGLVAMRQRNLNLLIGNSSVAHMGFVFLGIASLTVLGVTGAVMVMVAHGFLAALSFALSGYIHAQTKTLEMDKLGGLLRQMPFIGAVMVMTLLAGCGVPGFASFAGEIMVVFGAWKSFPLETGLAIWGALVIAGVYMMRAIRNILHGPLTTPAPISDAGNLWRKLPYALLVAGLILFGVLPRVLTDRITPSVNALLATVSARGTALGDVGHSPSPRPSSPGEGGAAGGFQNSEAVIPLSSHLSHSSYSSYSSNEQRTSQNALSLEKEGEPLLLINSGNLNSFPPRRHGTQGANNFQ